MTESRHDTTSDDKHPSRLLLDGIWETSSSDLPSSPLEGRTWYVEKRWWHFWR